MPSTYQRLQFIAEANRQGRLNSLLFHPDGPQSLLPALPDMIRLIEAASAVRHTTEQLNEAVVALTEDRP